MNLRSTLSLSSLPLKYFKNRLFISSPIQASFAVTLRCTCRCDYCDWWKYNQEDLNTSDTKRVIYQIARLGVLHVGISGGEPMLRPDLPELIKYAKSLGMMVSISTNGMISNKKMYKELMKSGLDTFTFSIDGSTAKIHEAFRKSCPFDKVISSLSLAINLRRREGYSTRINTTTTINRVNAVELNDIYEMCQGLGADHCNFQPIWPVMKDKKFFKKFGFTKSDKDSALLKTARKALSGMKKSNIKRYSRMLPDFYLNYDKVRRIECYAGRAFIYVDARGILYPCVPLAEPFGSLLDSGSTALLKTTAAKTLIKRASRQDCIGCSLNCHMERNVMMDSLKRPRELVDLVLKRFAKNADEGKNI